MQSGVDRVVGSTLLPSLLHPPCNTNTYNMVTIRSLKILGDSIPGKRGVPGLDE